MVPNLGVLFTVTAVRQLLRGGDKDVFAGHRTCSCDQPPDCFPDASWPIEPVTSSRRKPKKLKCSVPRAFPVNLLGRRVYVGSYNIQRG